MSRIKELKNQPEYNLNLVELLSLIIPTKKTKYVETLVRVMKKTKNIDDYYRHVKTYLNETYKISNEDLEKIPNFQLSYIYRIFDSLFEIDDICKFQKFCDYNERGLVSENDLTKYNSFDEIKNIVSIVEIKLEEKKYEKQIHKIYENEEWLILRPLTYESSLKYGANTKWCTAMEKEYVHFQKYSSNGILIYVINRKTSLKVGVFREIMNDCDSDYVPEFSFWNQKDKRVDSLESGLPYEILMVIMKEITQNPVSNSSLLDKETLRRECEKYILSPNVPFDPSQLRGTIGINDIDLNGVPGIPGEVGQQPANRALTIRESGVQMGHHQWVDEQLGNVEPADDSF